MAVTIPIALITLAPGDTIFGPFTLATATTGEILTVNRNVGAAPLQNAPSTFAVINGELETSTDNGASWQPSWSYTNSGGVLLDKFGQPRNDIETSNNAYPAGTQARVTVSNLWTSPITISGSLVLN